MTQLYQFGDVTAYASALQGGYTGTYAEFCADLKASAELRDLTEQYRADAIGAAQEAEGSKEAAGASADGAARTYSKVQESLSQMRSYVESAEGTLGEMKALAYTGGVMAMDVEQTTFTMKIACKHGRPHLYLSTVQTA